MCARFTQQLPAEEICDLYSVRGTPLGPNRRTRCNGAPGQRTGTADHLLERRVQIQT